MSRGRIFTLPPIAWRRTFYKGGTGFSRRRGIRRARGASSWRPPVPCSRWRARPIPRLREKPVSPPRPGRFRGQCRVTQALGRVEGANNLKDCTAHVFIKSLSLNKSCAIFNTSASRSRPKRNATSPSNSPFSFHIARVFSGSGCTMNACARLSSAGLDACGRGFFSSLGRFAAHAECICEPA